MIPLFKVHMPQDVDTPLLRVLHSGYITQGKVVNEFEAKFARYIGNPNVVSVNSGTSALTLALRLCDIQPGDKVITTPMTCSATNLPILSLGGIPVFCDVDPVTGLANPDSIYRLFSKYPEVKAVMVVDWGGLPTDIYRIREIARKFGAKVIVDAAHSLGTKIGKAYVGAQADFTCFSLQAIKHITTIDGGVLVCARSEDAARAKKLRWFGIDRTAGGGDSRIDVDITEWGYKFHMNDVNATIGIVQLDYIDSILRKHRANANYYIENLSDYFIMPEWDTENDKPAFWLFTLILPTTSARDKFQGFMTANNIQVSRVHKRNDEYKVFADFEHDALDGLKSFADRMICIPVHWGLTGTELRRIVNCANEFAKTQGG